MKIEIFSDFACPFCYVGQVRLQKAIEQLDFRDEITVVHRSYILDQAAPKDNPLNAYESLANSYQMTLEEAKNRIHGVEQMGQESGIGFRFDINKPTNTVDAHRVSMFAKFSKKHEEWIFAVFAAYFTEGKNIADKQVLLDLAKQVGLDLEKVERILDGNANLEDVYNDIHLATRRNVKSVPHLLINNRYVVRGAQKEKDLVAMLQDVHANEQERTYCDSGSCCF